MARVLGGKTLRRRFKKLELIKQEDKKIKVDKKVNVGFRTVSNAEDKAFLQGLGIPSGGGLEATCLIDATGKGIFWKDVSLFFTFK